LAGIRPRAGVAIAAGAAVGLGGVRARAGTRVARPRVVTLVGRGADDRLYARAQTHLPGAGPVAGVAVAAGAAVGLGWVRARAGAWVVRPCLAALPGGVAVDSVRARVRTRLARVRLRAGVAVAAGAAVGLGGVRARAGRRVARPRVVTLVGCG